MNIINTIGRRKESVAKVFFRAGTGKIMVNGKSIDLYFREERHRVAIKRPLELVGKTADFDFKISVKGGGFTGQTEAIQLGIARAIVVVDPETKVQLKKEKLLTRDPRMVEPKKYGLKKARRAPQFSKR